MAAPHRRYFGASTTPPRVQIRSPIRQISKDLGRRGILYTSGGCPPLTALAEQLKTAAAQVSAPESASMMTSYSSAIIDTIKGVQSTKDEILVVDLREQRVDSA